MATLTIGGLIGYDPSLNGPLCVRPVGHRIYIPMETSFVSVMRLQANKGDIEKRQIPLSSKYVASLDNSVVNINSN